MRLIHGHDYYDGAGAADPGITFVRAERTIAPTPFRLPTPWTTRGWNDDLGRPNPCDVRHRAELHFFLAIAGGAVVPGAVLIGPGTGKRRPAPGAAFIGAWEGATTTFGFDRMAVGRWWAEHPFEGEAFRDASGIGHGIEIDEHFLWREESPGERDWLARQGVATGLVVAVRPDRVGGAQTTKMRANGAFLGDVELFRALDPATAHMRIMSWIGGVLSRPLETGEPDSAARLRKAGFDPKASFRGPRRKR